MAHGEGAHLLEVNQGVLAVVSTLCHAARSTHCGAAAAQTVVSRRMKKGGPQITTECSRDFVTVSCEGNCDSTGAWLFPLVAARHLPGVSSGWSRALKYTVLRRQPHGEDVVRNQAAVSPHHGQCRGGALRFARRCPPDHGSSEDDVSEEREEEPLQAASASDKTLLLLARLKELGPMTRLGVPQGTHIRAY